MAGAEAPQRPTRLPTRPDLPCLYFSTTSPSRQSTSPELRPSSAAPAAGIFRRRSLVATSSSDRGEVLTGTEALVLFPGLNFVQAHLLRFLIKSIRYAAGDQDDDAGQRL